VLKLELLDSAWPLLLRRALQGCAAAGGGAAADEVEGEVVHDNQSLDDSAAEHAACPVSKENGLVPPSACYYDDESVAFVRVAPVPVARPERA